MITAAQALELVKRSDAEVEKCLALIGPAVEEAAKGGRRILPLSSITQLTNVEDVSFHAQRAPGALTEFQTKLMAALNLGTWPPFSLMVNHTCHVVSLTMKAMVQNTNTTRSS